MGKYADQVINLLKTSYSQFHSCKNIASRLDENGFILSLIHI